MGVLLYEFITVHLYIFTTVCLYKNETFSTVWLWIYECMRLQLYYCMTLRVSITLKYEVCNVAPQRGEIKRQIESCLTMCWSERMYASHSQNKVERCWPDEGWDTTGLCSVLVPSAGAGPCAGRAGTKVEALHGIGPRMAKVVFDREPGSVRFTIPGIDGRPVVLNVLLMAK